MPTFQQATRFRSTSGRWWARAGSASTSPTARSKTIGIERLHVEQDAGKSLHDQHPAYTLIDLNRAGVALMEIVSKPDVRSPEEAGAYLRKLRAIMRYLGTCDGNMEQGSMRCDVNVSVRPLGNNELRTRTEIKNVNSVRFVMQAIECEAERQVGVYDAGGSIRQETRLYDPVKGETRSMRAKEFAHDYRYFPDPDLLPLTLTSDVRRRDPPDAGRAPRPAQAALHRRLRPIRLRRRRADGGEGGLRLLRAACCGPRSQARRKLAHHQLVRGAEQAGPRHRRFTDFL